MLKDRTITTTLKILATAVATLLLLYVAYRLRPVLVWLVTGTFLAIIINPLVARMRRYLPGDRRSLATGVVVAILTIAVAAITALLVTPLVRQGTKLATNWPSISQSFADKLDHSNSFPFKFAREHHADRYIEEHKGAIQSALTEFGKRSLSSARNVLSGLGDFLVILAITVFMSVHGPRYMRFLLSLLPAKRRAEVRGLASQMYRTVTGYVNGNLITSLIAGIAAGGVATILDLPYPALLGLVVALADLIPMVGASLGAVIVVIVALLSSLTDAVIMTVFFIIYQQFENYVLVPHVMSKTVQLSAFAVFISALCGGVLGGMLGALVAIPAGACLQILVKYFYGNAFKEAGAETAP